MLTELAYNNDTVIGTLQIRINLFIDIYVCFHINSVVIFVVL